MFPPCLNGWGSDVMNEVLINPLVPLPVILLAGAICALLLAFALWRWPFGCLVAGLGCGLRVVSTGQPFAAT
jgi:hypothetical protein